MSNPFAKSKKEYFSNLDPKRITDHLKLQKSVELLFSDKITVKEKIELFENREILSSVTEIAKTLSNVVQYPDRKLPVEHGSLHKSSIGINREIKTSSKYHFYH